MAVARLTVLDANAPWVRSLFAAMPADIEVRLVHVYNPPEYLAACDRDPRALAGRLGRWRTTARGDRERTVLVPGLRRYRTPSEWLVRRALDGLVRDRRPSDVLVCTNPYLAPLLPALRAPSTVYYAHDAFEYFDWDRAQTTALQTQALRTCDLSFATARQLVEDFQPRTPKPVHHLPQAVAQSFLEALGEPPARPHDLRGVAGPLVGCIGVLNRTYDWDLVDRLTAACPEATFVFVGPLMTTDGTDPARVRASLAAPNVRWLGARPHEALPAYLAHCDVLLSPLALTPHNDRRCPLRLFDYLATDHPVLSTAVREAREFRPHIGVAGDDEEAVAMLRQMVRGEWPVDLPARRAWRTENTWEARARQALAVIEDATG